MPIKYRVTLKAGQLKMEDWGKDRLDRVECLRGMRIESLNLKQLTF